MSNTYDRKTRRVQCNVNNEYQITFSHMNSGKDWEKSPNLCLFCHTQNVVQLLQRQKETLNKSLHKLMLWLYYDFVVWDVWGGTNLNALQRCNGTVNESST